MPTKTTRRKAPAKKPRAGTGRARRARSSDAAPAPRKRGTAPGGLTDDRKAAMANGRLEANAVKRYLAIAGTGAAKRGRPVTVESLRHRLETIAGKLARTTNELKRLNLLSERMTVERELARLERLQSSAAHTHARAAFIEHAKSYSERHGIVPAAWRAMGVDAETLRQAGL